MIALPEAVLFDLDGTLIDSRGDIAAACNHALASEGRAPLPVDVVRGFVGDGARMLLARAFALPADDPIVTRALEAFRDYYEAHPTTHTRILPGVRELIDALTMPLAVVTNKPRRTADLVLERLGLRAHFREVRGGGDGPLKPDPTVTRALLASLGVSPARAWFVGDGAQDVGAGRAAGCFTIAVENGIGDRDALLRAEPHHVVSSLADLAATVRALR